FRSSNSRPLLGASAALLMMVACTASRPSGGPTAEQPAPRAEPKVLVVAGPAELTGFPSRSVVGGAGAATHLVEAGLALADERTGQAAPQLAEALPSSDGGSWKVNGDGTMETTYRLRPNLTWHDGTPFSSKDFVFGHELLQDPAYPYANREPGDQISRIDTPDDRTLVIHWKAVTREAGSLYRNKMVSRPRHILEPMYRSGEIERVINHPWWSREYVGTGPFRVVDFSPGEGATLEAFDGYAFGRPKVDRITWRSILDPNAALANVLANEVDITIEALGFEQAVVAKEQWAAKGEGTVDFTGTGSESVVPSPRNPWFDDVRVRRALLHALDREAMVQTLFAGLAPVAHFVLSPKHPSMS
ncbi:MAG: ABC transporter substrate-binding protein, partial [Acidimicrobiia bacterium]